MDTPKPLHASDLAPNSSAETAETVCDGCESFEILVRRQKRKDSVRYYCSRMHGYFDPFDCECPKDNEPCKVDRPRKFNRGWRQL